MTRNWWVKRLFPSRTRPDRRPTARPSLVRLEDRSVPATVADGGTSTLTITLDEAGETLTVVSAGTTYGFTTTGTKFQNGGVADKNTDFSAFNAASLTLKAAGLTRYDTISVVDSATGTKVSFVDSGGNAYADQFRVTLDNSSAGIDFNLASDFGANPVTLATDATLTVPSGATVTGSGGLVFRANGVAIDTSGTPGVVDGTGGRVTVSPFAAANTVKLGGADAAGVLGLTDAELGQIKAGVLQVGEATNTGGVSVTGAVTKHTGYDTLAIVTGGAVTQTAALAVADLRVSATGAVTLADAGNNVDRLSASAASVSYTDADAMATDAVDGVTGLTAASGDVTLTLGADQLLTATKGLTANNGNVTVNTDRVTLLAVAGFVAKNVVTIQPVSAAWAIDLGSGTNVAPGKLELFTTEVGRLKAPTVRIGDAANTGGIVLSDNVAADAGTATLVLRTAGAVTQTAGKTITAPQLAVTGSSVALDTGSHVVGTVAGKATTGDFAFKGGDPAGLTVGTVDGVVGIQALSGDITVRSVNGLTATGALLKANSQIALFIADGNASGQTATVSGASLDAPGGVTITGGAGSDTFNLTASADADIAVVGGNPSPPTLPGDTLHVDGGGAKVAVKFQGPDGSKGKVVVTGLHPIAFKQVETIQVVNALSTDTEVDGTTGDDVLVLQKVGGAVVFTLNGGSQLPVLGKKFTFNGSDGNDRMLVDFGGGDLGLTDGVFFNGDANTDTLQIDAAGLNGSYRPTALDGGVVTVGAQKITFATAEQADANAAGTLSVVFPGANDTLTVTNGKDFATNAIDALRVTGAFAPVALWGNTTVAIDTADVGGDDGDDTVTVASADNAHANTNLSIHTGTGTDTVTISGAVNVAGSFAVDSVAVNVNANVTAGTTVALTHTGELKLNAVMVSGATGVTESGGGAVTLTGDATAKSTGGAVAFGGKIDATAAGVQSLTVTAGTTTTLSQSAGQTTRLKALAATGAAINLGGSNYKTQLDQTYTGPVTLTGATVLFDSVAGAVTFTDSLDGAANVTVTAGGAATFAGPVGGATPLASLAATGSTIAVNGGSVNTTGGQTYNSPVTVGQDTTFAATASGAITFTDSLTGAFKVTVNTAGTTTFAKTVNVGALVTNVGGTTKVNGGLVTTTGAQTYGDGVVVGADATFRSTGNQAVAFNGPLDGGFKVAVETTGTTTFGGKVGNLVPLVSLTTNAGGTTQVNGGLVKTSGDQTYNDAVTVGAAGTFQSTGGGAVAFKDTLTSGTSVAVNTDGATEFDGAVSVGALTTNANGTTTVNTPTVTATGPGGLHFGDPVTALVDVTFAGTGGGPVAFDKALTAAGKAVAVNTTGQTTFGGAVSAGSLATDAGGGTAVNGGTVTTANDQTFGDVVTVGVQDATFTSTGGNVTFADALDGGFAVGVNTTGATRFFGPVGKTAPLASLTTDIGGTTQVDGQLVTTTGGQTFNDAVTIGANATFTSTESGAIQFKQTLNGPGGAAVNTAGATVFTGAVGGGTALAFLSTAGGGVTQVNGGLVRTTGGQGYGDPVTLGTNTQFTTTAGGGVTFGSSLGGVGKNVVVTAAGATLFNGTVNVGTLATNGGGTTAFGTTGVTTGGAQTYSDAVLLQAPGNAVTMLVSSGAGAVTFAATVDGPGGLDVETAGLTSFAGAVGGTTPLASLTTGSGGATNIGGGLVRTAGGQGYGDPVTLTAATTFTAGTVVFFQQTLTGAFDVATNSPQVIFQNAVNVGRLTVNAAAGALVGVTAAGPSISATNGQSYALPVAVTGDVTFSSPAGDVTFFQPLNGSTNVAVLSPGVTTFGGTVSLGKLATDPGGTTIVRGGFVTTAGSQFFGDAVIAADQNAVFTSTGAGDVVFGSTLSGGVGVTVNTVGTGRFDGAVSVGALDTDPAGATAVNTGSVQAAGNLTFRDPVAVSVAATFQAGGDALFGSSLGGPVGVSVQSPGTTFFGGAVNLAALATDAPGQTGVNGGSVVTTGGQFFGDPVGVGVDTTFASTGGGGITFGQTLGGQGRFAVVNTAGATVFTGAVALGALLTDAAGTTTVNGGSVATTGSQVFGDPVTLGAATTFAAGDQVQFGQTLTGLVSVLVTAPGATTFGGQVHLASLATDAAGFTAVNTDLIQTTGGQDYADAVAVNVATTFAGGAIAFRSFLTTGVSVALLSPGDVNLFAPVSVGSLTTDAGGRTIVRGGSVEALSGQSYGDDVLITASTRLATAAGDLSLLGRLDAETADALGLVTSAPAGTLLFGGAVGSNGRVASLVADAVTTRLAADFHAANDVAVTAHGGGVEQPAGILTTKTLGLLGSGTFTLDQLGSGLNAGNDITGTFRANVAGPIRLADSNDLTVDAAGIVTGNNTATIRTGRNFTAEDQRTAGKYSTPLVNVGEAAFVVDPGHFGPAVVTFDAEIDPASATFGIAGGSNSGGDEFRIRPSASVPIEVNGNAPDVGNVNLLNPGVQPDTLVPLLSDAQVAGFTYNGQDGVYTFNNRKPLTFHGIESLARRALAGFVVQTGEPRDATGAAQIQYAVRIVQTQAQQSIVDGRVVAGAAIPLPGGLDGKALLQNPFVVAPAFVNPSAPNAAPRIAFGDVNGDGAIDMVLANGPGTSPLVTVINGLALNVQGDNTLRKLEDLIQQGMIISQFYAYDPRFLGGINVAVADLDGDGSAEVITGAEEGGGPHVRVFNVKKGGDIGFFVYEPTFTGGVRVAAADVNHDGTPDLVLGAGLTGGPRVTVVDGKTLAETGNRVEIANFFAYDSSFRGGIYVDAGDYDNDGFADILTGPGVGGGSHVRVFSGKTALGGGSPTELAGFFAFDNDTPDNPLFSPGTPASGVGGVAFSGTSATGSRNILVGTGRGPQVQVKEYLGNGHTPLGSEAVDLLKNQQFIVNDVNHSTNVKNPVIFPLPSLLGYGASVGGFADPFTE